MKGIKVIIRSISTIISAITTNHFAMPISVPKITGKGPIKIIPPPFVSVLPLIDLKKNKKIVINMTMIPRKIRKYPIMNRMLLDIIAKYPYTNICHNIYIKFVI